MERGACHTDSSMLYFLCGNRKRARMKTCNLSMTCRTFQIITERDDQDEEIRM